MSSPWSRREFLGGAAAFAGLGASFGVSPLLAGAANGPPSALRRGFNLPDQAPQRPGAAADPQTLAQLRRLGMTHIRLPIFAEAFLSEYSGPATRGAALDDLDRILALLLKLDYAVTVDLHPGRLFDKLQRTDPQAARSALSAGWRGLAARLRRWPAKSVFAELLNEPSFDDDFWRPLAEELAGEIRTILPETTLIVGPAPFQRIEPLARWKPLADRNIVYAAHFYDPMIFTHQGLTWDKSSPYAQLAGVPFPLAKNDPVLKSMRVAARARGEDKVARLLGAAAQHAWTPETISAQFAPLAAWSARHDAPVVINEFGVLRFKAPRAGRLLWLSAVRSAAETHGFGWAHWDYSGGFGLLDESGQIDEGVIAALLPGEARAPRRALKKQSGASAAQRRESPANRR